MPNSKKQEGESEDWFNQTLDELLVIPILQSLARAQEPSGINALSLKLMWPAQYAGLKSKISELNSPYREVAEQRLVRIEQGFLGQVVSFIQYCERTIKKVVSFLATPIFNYMVKPIFNLALIIINVIFGATVGLYVSKIAITSSTILIHNGLWSVARYVPLWNSILIVPIFWAFTPFLQFSGILRNIATTKHVSEINGNISSYRVVHGSNFKARTILQRIAAVVAHKIVEPIANVIPQGLTEPLRSIVNVAREVLLVLSSIGPLAWRQYLGVTLVSDLFLNKIEMHHMAQACAQTVDAKHFDISSENVMQLRKSLGKNIHDFHDVCQRVQVELLMAKINADFEQAYEALSQLRDSASTINPELCNNTVISRINHYITPEGMLGLIPLQGIFNKDSLDATQWSLLDNLINAVAKLQEATEPHGAVLLFNTRGETKANGHLQNPSVLAQIINDTPPANRGLAPN